MLRIRITPLTTVCFHDIIFYIKYYFGEAYMNQNVCYNCGGEFVNRGGKLVCLYCGTIKPENVSGEELTLLYTAYQRLRLADFSDAEQEFDDIIRRHPNNAQAYWLKFIKHA